MEAPKARPRAARVPAPGALRVALRGILAVPDDFGRLRLLLLDEGPDGAPDGSWAVSCCDAWGQSAASQTPPANRSAAVLYCGACIIYSVWRVDNGPRCRLRLPAQGGKRPR